MEDFIKDLECQVLREGWTEITVNGTKYRVQFDDTYDHLVFIKEDLK